MWLALTLGLLLACTLALGGWFGLRGRVIPRTADGPATEPVPGHESAPASPPAIVFSCSACGKALKIKAALAGKKVKCPNCGEACPAPQAEV